jgi:GntR family transcriptional regulator, trigonelline degradation regulator
MSSLSTFEPPRANPPMTDDWMTIERNPAPLRSQVVEKLRTAIIEGVYKPGERLIERALCEALQISRPSLREAIRQLETEGLIENVPNRGPIVRTLTPEEVKALCDLCVLVEGLCARYFAEYGLESEVDAFEAALLAFEKSFKTGDTLVIRRAKYRYYEALGSGTHSDVLQTTLRRLNARLSQCWASSLRQPDRVPEAIGEMRVIVKAIRKRDPDAACAASTLYAQHFSAFVTQVFVEPGTPKPKRKRSATAA